MLNDDCEVNKDGGLQQTQIAVSATAPIDPLEVFRHMPMPQGINDLYTSQA